MARRKVLTPPFEPMPEGRPKGKLSWACDCGARFEETGIANPGDQSGYQAYMTHVRQHVENDEPERGIGLVDEDGVVWHRGFRSGAVRKGLIPYGKSYKSRHRQRRADQEARQAPTPYQGRIFIRDIPIPARLWDFFSEAAEKYEDYRDRSPEAFGRWLFDVVASYYYEHKEEYVLGRIAAEIVRARSRVA